jgi:dynein heavy chain 1
MGLPDFISDETAQRIKEFSTLNCFNKMMDHINENVDDWRIFMEHNQPETVVPLCWEGAGSNRK